MFFLLLGAWCFLGYTLVRRPIVARAIERHGHIVTPLVLLVLGALILHDSGIVAYLARAI